MADGGETGPELSHLEENSHFLILEKRFFEILLKYKEKESSRKLIHQQLKAEKLKLALNRENKALHDKITLLEEKLAQDRTKGSPIAPSWRQYEHQLKNLLHDGALRASVDRGKKRSSSDSMAEEKGKDHSRKKVHVVSIPACGANKKQTTSVDSEKKSDLDSNDSNLVVRKTVNRKKKQPLKKTGIVDHEDKVVTQNSASMDDSSLLGAVGLTVPAPSTASSHLNTNQPSPLHQDGGAVYNGDSGSTEANTSTSSAEVAIVTLPNNSMTVHEPQVQATTVSGKKKSAENTQPKKKVATSKGAENTQPKKKVDASKSAENTQPKKKVDASKSAENTQPKKKVDASKSAESIQPKKKVATSKSAENTQLKKKVATSKSAENTQPKKKVATSKSAENTQPKKKVATSKWTGNAVKSNQTETVDKEKKRGRPKKVTTPPPPLITINETKSRRGWPKGRPRKQKVMTTDPLTVSPAVPLPVSPAVPLPVSSQIAQPPFSVMPTETIPMETQVVAVHDIASTEDFRPGSSQDSHDDVIVTLSAQLESSPILMEKADSKSSPLHTAKKVDSESSQLHTAKEVDGESSSSHVTEQVYSEFEVDLVESVKVSKDSDSDIGQPRDPKARVLPFSLARKDPLSRTGALPVKRKTHGDEGGESPPNPKQPLYETTVVNKMEGVNKKGRKFNKSKSGTSFLPEHSLSVGNQSELLRPLLHSKDFKPPRLKQKVDTSNI